MQMHNHHHYDYYFRSLCLPGFLSTMSATPSSNGVFVVIPPSNASGLRPPPAILPTSLCQPPGIMQYEEPPLGAQIPRVTQPSDLRSGETFLTGEPKALGVRTVSPTTWGIGAGQGGGTHAPWRYVLCLVAQSCLTLCNPIACSLPGSSVHGDSPVKNTGVGCHALFQGIFPIQGSNPGLLHCRWILYCMSYHLAIGRCLVRT